MMYTPAHAYTQVRQEAKEYNALAKERGRQVKELDQQVRREEYLLKKSSRAVEAAAEHIERQQADIIELDNRNKTMKKALHAEQTKTKSQALSEHRGDIRRLQKQKRKLNESIETWHTRLGLALNSCCI